MAGQAPSHAKYARELRASGAQGGQQGIPERNSRRRLTRCSLRSRSASTRSSSIRSGWRSPGTDSLLPSGSSSASSWQPPSRAAPGYLEDTIYNVALCLVIGGIIGARGLYIIENLSDFTDDPSDIIAVNTGGISIYGALIGGTIGGWLYAYLRKVPDLPRGADIAAMGGILGMATGRIGDIINGEHFASDTMMPWGLVYTHESSPSYLQLWAEPANPNIPPSPTK